MDTELRENGMCSKCGPGHTDETCPKQIESREQFSDQIFEQEFALPMRQLMSAELVTQHGETFHLQDIFERARVRMTHLESQPEKQEAAIAAVQKELIRELVTKMKDMPSGTWEVSPKMTLETQKTNCSSAASIAALALQESAAWSHLPRVDFVMPYGHAMNIVECSDKTMWYVDPRNGIFEDITNNVSVEETEALRIYRIQKPQKQVDCHLLPALKNQKDALVVPYAGNMAEIGETAAGMLPEELSHQVTDPAEQQKIVQEAAAVQQRLGITSEQTTQYRALYTQKGAALHAFHQTSEYHEDTKRFLGAAGVQEAVEKAGSIMQSEPRLRDTIVEKIPEIREFLLGGTERVKLGNHALEQALEKLRDALHKQRTIVHTDDVEFGQKVDVLLSRV